MDKKNKNFFTVKALGVLVILLSFVLMSCQDREEAERRKKEFKEIIEAAVMISYDIGYKDAEAKKPINCKPLELSADNKASLELAALLCEGYTRGYNDFLAGKPNIVREAIDRQKKLLLEKQKDLENNKKLQKQTI